MNIPKNSKPKFKRRAAARPDEVLNAAQKLFLKNGFSATKVDDIARLANISKGAVYLYFPSKQAIIEALVNRAISPTITDGIHLLENFQGNPKQLISQMMQQFGRQLDNPEILAVPKIIMREAPIIPEIAKLYKTKILDNILPAFTKMLDNAMQNGHFKQLDPELTIRSIMGALAAHILLAEFFDSKPKGGLQMSKLVENHLTILFDGLTSPNANQQPNAN